MKNFALIIIASLSGPPVLAEETRQADAHEHGHAQLNVAIEESQVAMELHAPGSDIVGFEYPATSDEDHAKIDAALATLSDPLSLFQMPKTAGCEVLMAEAELEGEDEYEGHEDHDDHEKHAEEEHSEFHGKYQLKCADIASLTEIQFAFFDVFPNALEVEVQIISAMGARAFEVERDTPSLDLSK